MHLEFGIGLVQGAWVLDELPPNKAGAGSGREIWKFSTGFEWVYSKK